MLCSIPITADFRADVAWWREFVTPWNGVALLSDPHWAAPGAAVPQNAPESELFTDACNTGFGAVWDSKWLHGQWSEQQLTTAMRGERLSMPYLELLAVTIALCTWGHLLRGRRITVRSDSQTVVYALRNASSGDPSIMHLVRTILFLAATQQFAFRCVHVSGKTNTAADALSRGQIDQFRSAYPGHDSGPTPPMPLPTLSW